MYGEWASPATVGSYPLRSTAEVFADLQAGTARYTGPQPMIAQAGPAGADTPADVTTPTSPAVTVHVTGVSLGLARWDGIDSGATVVDLVPTYAFHAARRRGCDLRHRGARTRTERGHIREASTDT